MSETAENLPPIPVLSGAEKSEMRGLLQTLEAKIHVGKNGITPTLLKEIEAAFKQEDLLKIKFTADRKTIAAQIETIAEASRAALVGSVGKVAGFYRPGAEPEETYEEVEEVVEPKKHKKR